VDVHPDAAEDRRHVNDDLGLVGCEHRPNVPRVDEIKICVSGRENF
jgi:hypothetical protein